MPRHVHRRREGFAAVFAKERLTLAQQLLEAKLGREVCVRQSLRHERRRRADAVASAHSSHPRLDLVRRRLSFLVVDLFQRRADRIRRRLDQLLKRRRTLLLMPLPNPGVAPVGRTHRHPLLPHLVQHRHRLTGRQQVQGPERRVHRLERVRVRAAVLSALPEAEQLIDHRVGFLLSRQLVRGAHRSRRLTASHARGLRPVALLLVAAGKQRVLVRRRVLPRLLLVRRRRRVIVLYA